MAAPDSRNIKNLNGAWVMNKTLSDDPDPILALQGVGWLIRKAISYATITLHIKQYVGEDEPGQPTHIDIEQKATGGISGTTERRTLDWQERGHTDGIFGAVTGRSRWTKLEDVEDPFLKKGWLEAEAKENGVVQSYVESDGNGWTANQIWGFEEIDGNRYYVRHVVVTKEDERREARLVYDFSAE
ncbi:MAG: hypothetical protein M1837_007530 [Sclerophora amabilis]|nr:MAG: hypothetical protein M1837_007530 [Sclerophora amabilis]